MKLTHLFLLTLIISLSSCDNNETPYTDGGIHFYLHNETATEFQSAKFYIGMIIDEKFIPTDSLIELQRIRPNTEAPVKTNHTGQIYTSTNYGSPKGWKPNWEKIQSFSTKGQFLIKLSDGRELFFGDFNLPNPPLNGATYNIYIEEDRIFYPG